VDLVRIYKRQNKLEQQISSTQKIWVFNLEDLMKNIERLEEHSMRRMDNISQENDRDHGALYDHIDRISDEIHREIDSRLDKLATRLEAKIVEKPKEKRVKKEPVATQLNS
jgi:exonuclease VII large subunit